MKLKLFFQAELNLFVIFALVIFAFRESGLDYQAYLMEFNDPLNHHVSNELGYKILIKNINPLFDFWFLLLICNISFYIAHRKIINCMYEPIQVAVFLIYFLNLTVFLILGSPRRLIANSIVVYIIYHEFTRGAKNRNYYFSMFSSLFHTSSIVILPVIYLLRKRISEWFSLKTIFSLILGLIIMFFMLHVSGILDLIRMKIEYYLVYSVKEQKYLSEVPSVTSGFAKRSISLFLMWLAIRKWYNAEFVLKLGFVELLSYTLLGSLSPVLAVVATYFSVCYLLPFTMPRYRRCNYSTKLILFLSVSIYFVPTIIGLIRMFGDFYV